MSISLYPSTTGTRQVSGLDILIKGQELLSVILIKMESLI